MAKPRTGTDTPEKPEPERTGRGTFAPGNSGNPGGMPKQVVELRRLALEQTPKAFARIFSLVDSQDERVALEACSRVIARGLGKEGKAADLPDEAGADAPPASTAEILDVARLALGALVRRLTARIQGGHGTAEEAEQLARVVQTLGAVRKEEDEARKGNGLTEKSTEELLAMIPVEVLAAHLAARSGIPQSRTSEAIAGGK
jgi:hypothetical protein